MIGRYFFWSFFLCSVCGYTSDAQLINGRLTTSMYGWEQQTSAGVSTKHIRGYENIQLDIGNNNIAFHTYMQGSTDLSSPLKSDSSGINDLDPRLRLFNAYFEWKNIGDMIDIRLGRQSVYAGANYGSFDGGLLKVRPSDGVQVLAYGGGLTPVTQKFEFFSELKNNWQAGAQALFYLVQDTKIGLSYMNRHRESAPIETFRADAQMRLVPVTIDYGSRANQYASVDVLYNKPDWWVFGRYDYDFNFERTSRAEIGGRYQATEKLGVSVNFANRQSMIAYNSYFNTIESEANQEAVVGLDYEILPHFQIVARFSDVMYEDAKAWRFTIGASSRYASIMYTHDLSYDGSLDGFSMQAAYPMLKGKLSPHIGVNLSNYTLAEGVDKMSTLSTVVGATCRPWQQLSVDLQGQFMNNKIYKSDTRIFARINYWFAESFGITE